MWVMVKRKTLSLSLALASLLCIACSVTHPICHSPRFGSEAGREFQASGDTTVSVGNKPHREAMGLLSRCCGVAATLTTWLTSSTRTAGVVKYSETPRNQLRLASSEERAGAVGLEELPAILLPHEHANQIIEIYTRYVMKYFNTPLSGSVLDRTTANFPYKDETTNHSGSSYNVTNHSDSQDNGTTNHSGPILNFTNHSGILKLEPTNHSGSLFFLTNHSDNITYQDHGDKLESLLSSNNFIALLTIMLAIMLLVVLVLPPGVGGNGQGHNRVHQETSHRTPPRWGPEMESQYSFRTFITDLQLWSMMTDLAPHQQVAAVILRLSGAAKDLARTLTPHEIIHGGMVDGNQLDPLSYLVVGLHSRFAPLGEETRLLAMTELLSFSRRNGEGINQVLARYEIVRQRARTEGLFVMSTEGCALQLLRACGVSTNQMMQLLQPFQTNLPSNEQELNALFASMRRMGHIAENTPGNIGATLHARSGRHSHLLAESWTDDTEAAATYLMESGNGLQNPLQPTPTPEDQWTATYMANPSTGGSSSSWQNTSNPNPWGTEPAPHPGGSGAYWQSSIAEDFLDNDSGTETDTSSDSGNEEIDMSDLAGMDNAEASAHVYWQYRLHKRKWRRLHSKPTRKFRRIHKRFRYSKGKGRGFSRHAMKTKGNGKGQPMFHAEAFQAALTYLGGKGKGHRKHTSGKGTGRRMNPTGRDGQIMKCRLCNSPEHFAARCPQARTSTPTQLYVQTTEGPLAGILDHINPGVASYPIFSTTPNPAGREEQGNHTLTFMVRERTASRQGQNDPIWQQETDPWQGTARAVPKPPPAEHARLAPKAKAAPEHERSPWTNWAAHIEPVSAESSDTSRIAQASIQDSPASPPQPPRQRLRIRSDLSPSLSESPSPVRRTNFPMTLPIDINHGVNQSSANNHVGNTNGNESAFLRAARATSGTRQPVVTGTLNPDARQPAPLAEPSRIHDHQLQQFISGHEMANAARLQQRMNSRNPRAEGNTTGNTINLTPFQQITAMQFPRQAESSPQRHLRDPDPLGIFPRESLFAGMTAPQVNAAPTINGNLGVMSNPTITRSLTPPPPPPTAPPTEDSHIPVIFDGDNRTCTICQEELEHGQRVVRLRCRHVFHSDCWMSGMLAVNEDQPDCPNCRGQGSIIAMWDYIGSDHITQPGAPNLWPNHRHPSADRLINHGQSNLDQNAESINPGRSDSEQSDPEQQIEPDPRQALNGASSPEPTNRGRRTGPTLHHMGTPEHSHTESAWGTPDSQSSRSAYRPLRSSYSAFPRSRSASVHRRTRDPSSFIVLPSTYLDGRDWMQGQHAWASSNMTHDINPGAMSPSNHQEDLIGESDREIMFHSETRLPDGRPSLLIDPGSVANLCGDKWAQECARMAIRYGLKPVQNKRLRPLSVMGVGNGNQTCTHDCTLPIAMSRENDTTVTGHFTTPVVGNSELPGLLGLKTMRNNRAILDMVNLKLHFCGDADIDLTLPPGTKSFQLEISPSGHLVLPCTDFQNVQNNPPNPLRDTSVVLPVIEGSVNHGTPTEDTVNYHGTDNLLL